MMTRVFFSICAWFLSFPSGAWSMTLQPIEGRILRDSALYATAQGGSPICKEKPQPIRLIEFRHGRYLIELPLPKSNECSRLSRSDKESVVAQAWVDAVDADFDDAAMPSALERVLDSPGVRVAMNYSADKIFCTDGRCLINEPLYGKGRCYVHPKVAAAIRTAAQKLRTIDQSLSLLLLDCYRPVSVQFQMYRLVPGTQWVAAPKPPRYGGHNRGIALDLSLEKNGVPLDMGSGYDSFTDASNYDPTKVNATAHRNRTLLRQLMIEVGLRPYDVEWWHFSMPIDTPPLNVPL
jgi:zinc D-Ala-D-Ala dipeptidase